MPMCQPRCEVNRLREIFHLGGAGNAPRSCGYRPSVLSTGDTGLPSDGDRDADRSASLRWLGGCCNAMARVFGRVAVARRAGFNAERLPGAVRGGFVSLSDEAPEYSH